MKNTGRKYMRQFILLIIISIALGACKKPQVATLGSPLTESGITFTVKDYDIRFIEVSEEKKTFGYARPVLAIPVEMKNVGKDPFSYAPTHKTQQMTESSTPLLYDDPGKEAALPPESKTPIMGVYLERGALRDQITSTTTMKAGDVIIDTFLFEVPDTKKDLILSLPPTMHRGKLPVLIRIPFTPKEPTGPKISKMGETLTFGDVEFRVTHAFFEKVKSKHSSQGKGTSSEKLLKINYQITNKGDSPILFDPAHRDLSGKGANLFGADRAYKRVKFSSSIEVIGQLTGTVNIAPGKSIEDFVLFDVNENDFKGATLEYPANLFSKHGVARFNVKLTGNKVEKAIPKKVVEKAPVPAPDMGSPKKTDAGQ